MLRLARSVVVLLTVVALCGAAPPRRIVSLVPSLTEDLFAIGAGPSVVAVSQFTSHPSAARRLPVVASFVSIETERIVRLHPDLVVGIPSQQPLVANLQRLGVRVVLLPDDSYEDLFFDLRELGRLTGRERQAAATIRNAQVKTAALRAAVHLPRSPSCLVVLGVEPVYTVGNASYIARLVGFAGGHNAASIREAYAPYSPEAIVASRPDVIVADAGNGLAGVLDREPWRGLDAVRKHHVYYLSDPSLLQVPGPRYNEGLAWLMARFREATAPH